MSVAPPLKPSRLPLFLRFALRELRGGLRGFYIVLACIALGAGTIAAVNSLAEGLAKSITEEGQAILGGDMAFSLIHRQASDEELAFLESIGTLSTAATLRGMARISPTDQTLVEVKGIDGLYPLYGSLDLTSGATAGEVLTGAPEGTVPALVDESFLAAREMSVGDQFDLGNLRLTVMDTIEREPDRLAGGVAFGPRVMVPLDALAASGLTDRGSLVRWRYRVAGPDGPLSDVAIASAAVTAEENFPSAGWRIESRAEAAPGLRDSIDQFAQFLTLVGLTSLAVGGIGVANAVRAYLLNKRPVLATLRTMGAPAGLVFRIYMTQVLIISAVGIVIGLCIGAIKPPIAALLLDGLLPVSALERVFPVALAFAALFGLLTAITFSLLPTARAVAVPPVAILREDEPPAALPRSAWVALAVSGSALCALILFTGYDIRLGASYIVGAAALFVVLRILASAIQWGASRLPRSRSPIVRIAIANLHRPGALTPTVTVALGLALTLLVTLSLVDANIRNALVSRLPDQAPTFFFVDIQDREKDAVLELLDETAPTARIASEPLLRGRIVSINGVAARDWPPGEADWVLR
ncbi:MAG: FtsX-like permease family protein, partial [Pseudomonadota bacterium]